MPQPSTVALTHDSVRDSSPEILVVRKIRGLRAWRGAARRQPEVQAACSRITVHLIRRSSRRTDERSDAVAGRLGSSTRPHKAVRTIVTAVKRPWIARCVSTPKSLRIQRPRFECAGLHEQPPARATPQHSRLSTYASRTGTFDVDASIDDDPVVSDPVRRAELDRRIRQSQLPSDGLT